MGGLARICKIYGRINVSDENGNRVTWLYDYVNNKPRLESEMTSDEIKDSEKAKWKNINP